MFLVGRRGTGLLLLIAATRVQAQIYSFDDQMIPANGSMQFLYAFYVYSYEDAPVKYDKPFVTYQHITAHSTLESMPNSHPSLAAYNGLQVSIIRYRDFWDLIDPDPAKHCSTQDDVDMGRASGPPGQLMLRIPADQPERRVNIYRQTVPFESSQTSVDDSSMPVKTSGVYILVFSNCGKFNEATATGQVLVKNAYGYLPGNEYHKLPFYGYLAVAYLALAICWAFLSLRWWKDLFPIQNCVFGIICLSLLESLTCYWCLRNWNADGERSKVLFIGSILVGVVKTAFSYMLILVASLGWGVTKPFLEDSALFKIKLLSAAYIVLDSVRETVLSFRHSHALSLPFVLLCVMPVSMLNGAIFYWVFTSLAQLLEQLEARRQEEKLLLFQRLWKILVAALGVATFSLLYHIFSLSRSIAARWRLEWLFTDGFLHGIFLVVLVAIMYLLAPNMSSKRYAYAAMPADGLPADAIWADEDLEEEADDFWAATSTVNKRSTAADPEPEVFGASGFADEDGLRGEDSWAR